MQGSCFRNGVDKKQSRGGLCRIQVFIYYAHYSFGVNAQPSPVLTTFKQRFRHRRAKAEAMMCFGRGLIFLVTHILRRDDQSGAM